MAFPQIKRPEREANESDQATTEESENKSFTAISLYVWIYYTEPALFYILKISTQFKPTGLFLVSRYPFCWLRVQL